MTRMREQYGKLSKLLGATFNKDTFPLDEGTLTGLVERLEGIAEGDEKSKTSEERPKPESPGSASYGDKSKLKRYITEVTGIEIPRNTKHSYPKLTTVADALIEYAPAN